MAETESPEVNCVYVDTNLDTHLLILVHNNETISDFKDKLCKEHYLCFPKIGEINISAVKVERQNTRGVLLDYHLPDSMFLSLAFEGVSNDSWFVSVDADVCVVDKCEELMDADGKCLDHEKKKNKEIATGTLILGGYTKNQTLEQDLGTEKTTKKRKLRSGKKPPNHEKNKEIASDSLVLDGYAKNQTPEEDLETPVVEKPRKKRKLKALDGETSLKDALVDVSQSTAAATATATTDVDVSHELCGNVASESLPREKPDDILTKTTEKEIEMGEKSVEDLEGDKTENNDLVSHPANLLDTDSGLTTKPGTEKKKRRKKRSEDDINQSSAAATVSEGVPANVDHVDATPESLLISGGNFLAEASQKENDLAENSVDDVARDKTETDNLESHTEVHVDSTNLEKETKKSSNDDINLSSAAAAIVITSGDVVNQINEVPVNVDPVDATPESLPISRGENRDTHSAEANQKENEMVEKSVEDVGRENTETDNIASRPENHLDTNSGLTTRPETEKKKKRKKRSKDDTNQSSASAAITTSMDIVNEKNGVPANVVDPVEAAPESLPISRDNPLAESSQRGNEKVDDDVGSEKAKPSAEDNIQTNNVELDDADGTKSVKPSKKRKSKKAKTVTEEDAPVASGAQNVEANEAVDGEGTDNVIRTVLDSLQEQSETEGNLDRTGKKSSKKAKKKHSSKVGESQVMSVEVNNPAVEETPLSKSPKDTDVFFTPAKKDTESLASLLKKTSEIAEDNNLPKKVPVEKVDMGDNFGCSPNQKKKDQVAGGAKSKKEKKKGLDLHPSGSVADSLNSVKPKEKKSRGQQPASSGASHLKSMVKSGSVKTTVSSKKQELKKSSKPVAVDNKRKTNFFADAENGNSSEDEYNNKTSNVSTKTPSDYSSENDSDVTSMSRKQQGNNLAGGAKKFEGSLQDLLRRSSSYKKALIKAQSQPDIDDESPVDCVPDSQGV